MMRKKWPKINPFLRKGFQGKPGMFWLIMGVLFYLGAVPVLGAERFPRPEFQSGYTFPNPNLSGANLFRFEYIDPFLLLLALILGVLFLFKWRSRRGLFYLSLGSVIYFGFYRGGCICPAGSLQNILLAWFDRTYALPVTVLALFLLPIIFSLFYGRVFCGSVCPLGVLQDLVIFRPLKLPAWVTGALGLIPYLYLGLTVISVATGSGFLVCRYDPFIAFFHRCGPALTLLLGSIFLIAGIAIARPYCRFFCPYGLILGWLSVFAGRRLQIAPDECIQCRLCESACPSFAILQPTGGDGASGSRGRADTKDSRHGIRRLVWLTLLLPVIIGMVGFITGELIQPLANTNPQVQLYRQLTQLKQNSRGPASLEIQAFLESGDTVAGVSQKAAAIWRQTRWGGWLLGGFLGLVIWLTLVRSVIIRTRNKYEPDPAHCLHCGRCLTYCPIPDKSGENKKPFLRQDLQD